MRRLREAARPRRASARRGVREIAQKLIKPIVSLVLAASSARAPHLPRLRRGVAAAAWDAAATWDGVLGGLVRGFRIGAIRVAAIRR